MRNREGFRPAWPLIAAFLAFGRAAAAEDDTVRVTCAALTPEDAAQVEARTRATLLTTDDRTVTVRIDCVADTATVRVVAGERTESTVVTLSGDNARETLLAAVERTLAALEGPSDSSSAAPPAATTPTATPVVVPPPKTEPAPAPQPAASPERRASAWQVGAGVVGELWDGAASLGARVTTERRVRPWSVGVAFGWLTPLGNDDPFRADELHAFAFGALEEERATGIVGSLGAGLSILTVAPAPEVQARSDTTLPLVMFELGVSRPVRFGRASLLPGLDVRLFPGRREVIVDANRKLVLPPLCPSLFLGFGYEI